MSGLQIYVWEQLLGNTTLFIVKDPQILFMRMEHSLPDAEVYFDSSLCVFAGVRVEMKDPVLSLDWDGLEEIEGPTQEIVSFLHIMKEAGGGRERKRVSHMCTCRYPHTYFPSPLNPLIFATPTDSSSLSL